MFCIAIVKPGKQTVSSFDRWDNMLLSISEMHSAVTESNNYDLYSHTIHMLLHAVSLSAVTSNSVLCQRTQQRKREMYRGTNKDNESETKCSKTQQARLELTEIGGVGCNSVGVEEREKEKREKS